MMKDTMREITDVVLTLTKELANAIEEFVYSFKNEQEYTNIVFDQYKQKEHRLKEALYCASGKVDAIRQELLNQPNAEDTTHLLRGGLFIDKTIIS